MKLNLFGKLALNTTNLKRGSRIRVYKLIPYGKDEVALSSKGRFTAKPGALKMARGALALNLEHDATSPVGRIAAIWERPDGLYCSVGFARTTLGDDTLEEARLGLRDGISAEIQLTRIENGVLTAGVITGAACCTDPAFDSARLHLADEIAPDTEETAGDAIQIEQDGAFVDIPVDMTDEELAELEAKLETIIDADPEAVAVAKEEDQAEEGAIQLTTSRRALRTPNRPTPRPTANRPTTFRDFCSRMASAHQSRARFGDDTLLLALDQITKADNSATVKPQWLGELWSAAPYVRRFVPLVTQGVIDEFGKIGGWKFADGKTPQVTQFGGYPADVPSNEVAFAYTETEPLPYGGAWEHDRARVDFASPAYWEGFYRECAESYKKITDKACLTYIMAETTTVAPGTVPPAVSATMAAIVDGAIALLERTERVPQWAIVPTNLWRDWLLTRSDDKMAYLEANAGLDEGTLTSMKVVPASASLITDSSVYVGTDACGTWFQEPGDTPIRVEALNVGAAGIQTGVFGYAGFIPRSALEVSKVTLAAG